MNHKLQERSTPCVYLGPAPNHRGSKCYNMSSGKIIICRHVRFIENTFPFSKIKNVDKSTYDFLDDNSSLNHFLSHNPNIVQSTTPPSSIERPSPHSGPNSLASPNSLQTTIPHSISQGLGFPSQPNPSVTPSSPIPHTVTPPRPEHLLESENPTPTSPTPQIHSSSTQQHIPATMQRTHHMTTRSINGIFKPNPTFHTNLTVDTTPEISPIPKNPVSALRDKNWKTTMWDEFIALIDNNTWELVPKPSNVNVIRSMWIFRHKYKSDGSFERYKARLVGNGNTQQQGVDCDETFSPVVKPATIRAVLSIALSKSWSIHQMDVKNAFLHGQLQETVYMHQPLGFRDKNYPDHVCLLKKSLYGLKQAPRAWYQRFSDFVGTIGFCHSKSDHSLFIYRNGSDIAYILLYVDDIILTASSACLRKNIMTLLSSEFAMKDLGRLSYFLGIAVTHISNGLFLSQKQYAASIIARAGMSNCSSCPTPVDTKSKLSGSAAAPYDDPTKFRSLAGALQYLTFTRPDISYAVQQICLHMHAPTTEHIGALKRIIRYLQGTLSYGLHLYKSTVDRILSYTDAD